MKILQLMYESLGSPFGFGGASVRACEIYHRLRGRHEVTLLCMKYPGARDGEREGLLRLFRGRESGSLTSSVLAYTIAAADFVRRYGRTFDIIVENFLPSTPFFSRFLTRTPVILQVQGIMEEHARHKYGLLFGAPMAAVEGLYPRLYERFIFVSPVTERKVLSRRGGEVRQSAVIPNGVSDELLHAWAEEGDYLLFFSRIDTYTKGIDLLIKAFERLSSEDPSLRLVLAGYELDRFDRIVGSLAPAVRKRISYVGFLSGTHKTDLLAGARAVVLPSRHESAPISILEAAACGRPLVVSDIPELRFVGDSGLGLTFPSGSVVGLTDALRMVLNDRSLRDNLGAQGRAYAGQSRWEHIAAEFESFLTSAI